MLGTRHEEYKQFTNSLPFVLNINIERSAYNKSRENNWHENLEIQFGKKGDGWILIDGQKHTFAQNDIAVINSNVIHYTGTDSSLIYDCIIISTDFCRQIGINPSEFFIKPHIKNQNAANLFLNLIEIFNNKDDLFRIPKLNKTIIELLIYLSENYSTKHHSSSTSSKKFDTVKNTICFIRKNYQMKINLDQIAKAVLCDKYTLCKDFKMLTGQTIIENLNNYRSIKAIDYLQSGYSVTDTALKCGFENISFFTKTFKKYIGKLPSEYKK